MSLTARFPGAPCDLCCELIQPGDLIEGSDPGWHHVTCPDPLDTNGQQPCPTCYLIHPEGKCDR